MKNSNAGSPIAIFFIYLLLAVFSAVLFYQIAPWHDSGFGLINEPISIGVSILISIVFALLLKIVIRKMKLLVALIIIVSITLVSSKVHDVEDRKYVPGKKQSVFLEQYLSERNISYESYRIATLPHVDFHGFKPKRWKVTVVLDKTLTMDSYKYMILEEGGIPPFVRYKLLAN